MILEYKSSLQTYSFWYEHNLGICRIDLNQSQDRDDEHDDWWSFHLYKNGICENALDFGDPGAVKHTFTNHKLKVSERASDIQIGVVAEVDFIDDREDKRRKGNAHSRSVRKIHAQASYANYGSHNGNVS